MIHTVGMSLPSMYLLVSKSHFLLKGTKKSLTSELDERKYKMNSENLTEEASDKSHSNEQISRL